jgi:RimJ/RimL family protein N-acetyltransferase
MIGGMKPPPERIPLADPDATWPEKPLPALDGLTGVELRRWTLGDAPAVFDAVTASFDHLHPWAPWAVRRPAFEDERAFVMQAVRDWNEGRTFGYGIFDPDGALLGSSALMRPEGTDDLEIGYWVHVAHTRRGLATAATAALTRAAFALPWVDGVRIRCDEANVPSVAVPRRLGYRLDHVEVREPAAPGESGRLLCWVMTRDAYGWR